MLNSAPLKRVNSYRYLGVLITADLMWPSHIANICNKARRLTGVLYRKFYKNSSTNTLLKLYTSFIRPHLEYACIAWDPFLKKDITLLEDVQKFALKICMKSWDLDYDTLLSQSHLPSLASRRQQAKLCRLDCIINNESHFPDAPLVTTEHHHNTRSSQHPVIRRKSTQNNLIQF